MVLAFGVAFFLSRPAAIPNQDNPKPTFAKRVLTGKAFAPQQVSNFAVGLYLNEVMVASSKVENGDYRLELPEKLPFDLVSLANTQLLHGEGRLPAATLGAESKLVMFDDANQNGTLDAGEPQLEASFFPPDKEIKLQGFFRYKLLLVGSPTRFIETQDSASGAKGFYRYNLPLESGFNMLEGEFASNGYDVRLRSGDTWNIVPMLPRGGNTSPPGFTSQ